MKYRSLYTRFQDRIIDYKYNIETCACIIDKKYHNEKNFMYEGTPYRTLRCLFEKYPFTESDYVMDFGCGKGRVLAMAMIYGCKHVYGIDLSSQLLEIANNNLNRIASRCENSEWKLIEIDAKKYIYDDRLNKVYMFNPFELRVLIYVIKNLLASYDRCPRKILIYLGIPHKSKVEYMNLNERIQLVEENKEYGYYVYTVIK